jgi:acyl dehydratase
MFAEAIGETDPVYLDVEAARAEGHPDVLAPPTVLFGLDFEHANTVAVLSAHGVALRQVLHGEQTFRYHTPVYAGDMVIMRSRFVNTYAKAGGALEFIVRHTDITTADGTLVAEMDNVAVIRNARGGA